MYDGSLKIFSSCYPDYNIINQFLQLCVLGIDIE